MTYIVIDAEANHVDLWDGRSKDKHLEPAGVMTLMLDNADRRFQPGDKVRLEIVKVRDGSD